MKQQCTKDFLDIFADTMGDRGGWPWVTNSLKCPGCMVDPGFPGMPTQSGLRMLLDEDFTVDKAAALVARFGDWHDSMCLLAKDNVHTEEHYSELISSSCSVLAQEFRGKDVSLSEHANMSRLLIGVEKVTRFDPENHEVGFQVGWKNAIAKWLALSYAPGTAQNYAFGKEHPKYADTYADRRG